MCIVQNTRGRISQFFLFSLSWMKWTFVACYTIFMRFTGLQEFSFKPGYAACLNEHLYYYATIVRYFVVIRLFVVFPPGCHDIQLQKSFEKNSRAQRGICAISLGPWWKYGYQRARDSFKQIFVRCRVCIHVLLDTRLDHKHLGTHH